MSEQIKQINELIKDVKFAMLTTVTKDGHLHACPMKASLTLTKKKFGLLAMPPPRRYRISKTTHRLILPTPPIAVRIICPSMARLI